MDRDLSDPQLSTESERPETDRSPVGHSPEVGPTPTVHRDPEPPRLWTVFTAMIAVIAATQAIRSLAMELVKLPRRSNYGTLQVWGSAVLQSPWGPAFIVLPFQISLIGAIAIAAWIHRGHARERLGWLWPRVGSAAWGHVVLGWVAELIAGIGIFLAVAAQFDWTPPSRASTNLLLEGIGAARGVERFGWWFAVALLPAVCEETFYRGVVQRRLLQRMRPVWAIAITAVVFAAFHVDRIVEVAPLAFYLGWLAWRFDSVIPGILVHLMNNSMIFGIMTAMPAGTMPSQGAATIPRSALPLGLVVGGLGLALLIRSLRAIHRATAAPAPPGSAAPEPEPLVTER